MKIKSKIFEPILLAAIKKNPQKFSLHELLIQQYYRNKQFEKALQLIDKVIDSIGNEPFKPTPDFSYYDYIYLWQYKADILYITGAIDSAFEACNYVMENLPMIVENGKERHFYEDFGWTLLIRAAIHLERNNVIALHSDLRLLLTHNDLDYFEQFYPEYKTIIHYIYNLENDDVYKWYGDEMLGVGVFAIDKP